ncbi:MAG: hypothetical protein ACO1O1_13310 [Adhaeribacter sp.]
MKNWVSNLRLISFIFVFVACSEDTMVESLSKNSRLDNSQILPEQVPGFTSQLDLTKPELSWRVQELRDSINYFMAPEMLALKQLGRDILRQRGIDPDTAFPGGPNDIRLALIPEAARQLDKLNEPFTRRGYVILDVYPLRGNGRNGNPVGSNTPGPWDYYWEAQEKNAWIDLTVDEFDKCIGVVLEDIGIKIGAAAAIVTFYGAGPKALISLVGTGTLVTVSAALGLASAAYFTYKMDKCVAETIKNRECEITINIEEWCRRKRSSGEQDIGCDQYYLELAKSKMHELLIRVKQDTFNLVIDASFFPEG